MKRVAYYCQASGWRIQVPVSLLCHSVCGKYSPGLCRLLESRQRVLMIFGREGRNDSCPTKNDRCVPANHLASHPLSEDCALPPPPEVNHAFRLHSCMVLFGDRDAVQGLREGAESPDSDPT